MADEPQTPAAEAAPASAAPETEQAKYQRLMDAENLMVPDEEPTPEPKPEPKPEATVPLDAMKRRIGRITNQRDKAREEGYLRAGQLDELRDIVGKLRKMKAEDYPTFDAYEEARRQLDARAEKASAPEAPEMTEEMIREVNQATRDLAYDIQRDDPDLWAEAVAQDGDRPRYAIPAEVVLAVADHDDSAGLLRAYLALDPDDRQDIVDLSPRAQRKAMRGLQPLAKAAKAEKKPDPEAESAPEPARRDPSTGQFVKRQSSAPEPVNPLSGSSAAQKPVDSMSTDEYIATMNNRESAGERFGW